MKTSALVFLCAFSLSLAYFDDYIEDPWENEDEAVNPESIKLQGKVYNCTEDMDCDCPKLLCTGVKSCRKGGPLLAKCRLAKDYSEINLQDAKRKFWGKDGDCYCQ
ncbi:unnamed protein product [Porites evermanni]|uniref:Uncharacterized protein n=1 Tax=Porites evermanni TaxID=104178 RepID=A0ABN8SV46_9CNID|nr:unnamed protein product [Porites evermanni]